jgi:hypothetical protein
MGTLGTSLTGSNPPKLKTGVPNPLRRERRFPHSLPVTKGVKIVDQNSAAPNLATIITQTQPSFVRLM